MSDTKPSQQVRISHPAARAAKVAAAREGVTLREWLTRLILAATGPKEEIRR